MIYSGLRSVLRFRYTVYDLVKRLMTEGREDAEFSIVIFFRL